MAAPPPDVDLRPWREYILAGSATLLVGAGISAEQPANLPLGAPLVKRLTGPLVATLGLPVAFETAVSAAIARLRPEVTIDVLLEHLGPRALQPLNTALEGVPNRWHAFLAGAIAKGCSVVTTNFDTLIEQSCDSTTKYTLAVGKRIPPRTARDTPTRAVLYKIHGSLEPKLQTIALAVRHVGRGLTRPQAALLRTLAQDRPLIVLGYSGHDQFDILPALVAMHRTAPGLWILHKDGAPLSRITAGERRRAQYRPPIDCARAWTTRLEIVAGDSRHLRPARIALPVPVRRLASQPPHVFPSTTCGVALIYLLIEARAFDLITPITGSMAIDNGDPRFLIARATASEKQGTDLHGAAALADRARAAANDGPSRLRALADDQVGVIARRRGDYRTALNAYNRALRGQHLPAWLIAQIRSHKAVALEYLNRRKAAVREATAVAQYEARVGDLRGLVKSWNNIGIAEMNQKHWDAALDAFKKSENLKLELHDARGLAQTLHNRGKLFFLRKDFSAAKQEFDASLRLRRGLGRDRHGIAQSLIALATVAKAQRNFTVAQQHANDALEAHRKCGDAVGIQQAQQLLRSLARRNSKAPRF